MNNDLKTVKKEHKLVGIGLVFGYASSDIEGVVYVPEDRQEEALEIIKEERTRASRYYDQGLFGISDVINKQCFSWVVRVLKEKIEGSKSHLDFIDKTYIFSHDSYKRENSR